jgi:hypothetical protein
MAWAVKAECLAHDLRNFIGAPKFQNYAMARLFQAYKREVPKANITSMMLQRLTRDIKLKLFLEDPVIQEWGDLPVVDRELTEWAGELRSNDSFPIKFKGDRHSSIHTTTITDDVGGVSDAGRLSDKLVESRFFDKPFPADRGG